MATESMERPTSDLAIPPGELLEEELNTIGMSQAELAARTGRPVQVINEIIRGKKQITHDTAIEFEKVLGIPAHLWIGLETNHQLTLARLREDVELAEQIPWLDQFPIREMEKRGWIPRCPDPKDRVRELLRFLGVASFSAWQRTVLGFRISPRSNVSWPSLAVWLRKGELEGLEVRTDNYEGDRFLEALSQIRPLTRQPPQKFVPRAKDLCARSGVALVFVPELPNSAAFGSARWLSPNKALIQLSLRYKTNDQLWFSFFHEACHVIRHRVKETHIDGIDGQDRDEEEADCFAEDTLIPHDEWTSFIRSGNWTRSSIEQFARRVDVAPGIIVGRLQHQRLLPWNSSLNSLKVRLTWAKEDSGQDEDR